MAALHPALEALLAEHLEDHGTALPTLFMADVQRWVAARYREGDRDEVAALLGALERLYAAGGEAEDLIAVGFIEAMHSPSEPAGGMRSMLGPGMARQYRVTWNEPERPVPPG